MKNSKTEIIKGSAISNSDLEVVNEYRKKYFDRNKMWDHETNNHFHDRIIFLLKEDSVLKAFCTIRDFEVYVNEVKHEILGLQLVSSVEKGKGYGKILMEAVKEYISKQDKTLIGFSEKHITLFYKKTGFNIYIDGSDKFVYVKDDGERYKDGPGDAIFIGPKDSFMFEVVEKNLEVIHYVPHW